ncbi:unnamed protein product, partial [Staurois parvus]
VGVQNVPASVRCRRNSAPSLVLVIAPSLVLVEGILPHHWYWWKEYCPIISISGRNSAPSLVTVGGMVPHHWCQREE